MKWLISLLALSFIAGFIIVGGAQYEKQQEQQNGSSAPPACTTTKGVVSASGSVKLASTAGLTKAQIKYTTMNVQIATKLGLSGQDILTGVATQFQESGGRNLAFGDRDSLGLYQQRAGWGTAKQRLDPTYAINKFYSELKRLKGRSKMSNKQAALRVQRPSLAAYNSPGNNFDRWLKRSKTVLGNIVNKPAGKAQGAAMVYNDCPKSDSSNLSFSKSGWTKPLNSLQIGSPFGPRFHPILHYTRLHNGIDLSSPKGAKIYATGPGKVISRDMGYNGGAGNYIAIDVGGGYVFKYLHQSRFADGISVGDRVKAGTVIGYVGSTGLSTGPHLHLQLNKNGRGVDPVPFLCARGIKVPGPKGCAKYGN